MTFRKDINALRAIAVLGVLVFHFNPAWLPGGFAGVDVFFVLSGYLMTAIIVGGLEKNQFSLTAFYSARANRLIPALAVLCGFLLLWGWFFMLPEDYKTLSKHAGSSIAFISNLVYWREINYFNLFAREKWLLHTWSLSVEWQFYLAYPLILMLLHKVLKQQAFRQAVLAMTAAAFVFSVLACHQWPKAAYYLLPTRAWEMMAGGLVWLYPVSLPEKVGKWMWRLGLLGIVLSFALFSEHSLWPGYWAAVPVAATAAVLLAERGHTWLNHAFFQAIGSWSYSIYLWHWPVAAAVYYYSLPSGAAYAGMVLSVGLGFLSYRFVERIRLLKIGQLRSPLLYLPPYWVLATGLAASHVFLNDGMPYRYSAQERAIADLAQQRNPHDCIGRENTLEPCFIGRRDNIQAVIVGDSHAESITTALADVLDKRREGMIALNKSGCLLVKDVKFVDVKKTCPQENIGRLAFLDGRYEGVPVFLVSRTSAYLLGDNNLQGMSHAPPLIYFSHKFDKPNPMLMREFEQKMTETVCQIRRNHPVFIIQPIPEMRYNIPKAASRRALLFSDEDSRFHSGLAFYRQRNAEIREIFKRVAQKCDAGVLDPAAYLCNETECLSSRQGIPLYFDDDHLNEYGNRLLMPMFQKALSR